MALKPVGQTIGEIMAALALKRPCKLCGSETRGQYCDDCYDKQHAEAWAQATEHTIGIACESLPARFRGLSLGGDAALAALNARVTGSGWWPEARRAIEGDASLVLRGPSGAGKTTLAAACYVEAVRRVIGPRDPDRDPGEGWRWREAERCTYARALRLAACRLEHGAGNGEPPLLARAADAPVLLLDDLGLEPLGRDVLECVFERADNGMQTIVTTSQSDEQLTARYGEGIARRILQPAIVIELGGA